MKIAYLSTFFPYRGGIAQFNANLFREFEKISDIKAFTFTRQYPNSLFPGQSQFVNEHDHADEIPSERILDTINPLTWFSTAKKIIAYQPDILVMKLWMPFFSPSLGWVAKLCRRKGIQVITILDNVIPHEKRPGDLFLLRFFLKQNDAFIAMSKTVEKDLLSLHPTAHYLVKAHPVYDHFPQAVSSEYAKKTLGLPEDKIIFLFFGFIRGYKGLDILLQSIPHQSESIHFVIAGEVYGSFSSYQNIIDDLKIMDRLSLFTRYISDQEVTLFFSSADACVLPYHSATQSGIVQIAFHYNCPPLVTDVGGLSEMVDHEVTGFIIPKATALSISDSIKQVVSSGKLKKYRENIAIAKKKLDWKSFAETVLQLVK